MIKKKDGRFFMQASDWSELIERWSQVTPSPEQRLIAAIIGNAIHCELSNGKYFHRPESRWYINSPSFICYCRLLDIEPTFIQARVREAIESGSMGVLKLYEEEEESEDAA